MCLGPISSSPNSELDENYQLLITEKYYALNSINALAVNGSIFSKFVGAACHLNLYFLAHRDASIRTQAFHQLLDQVILDYKVHGTASRLFPA